MSAFLKDKSTKEAYFGAAKSAPLQYLTESAILSFGFLKLISFLTIVYYIDKLSLFYSLNH